MEVIFEPEVCRDREKTLENGEKQAIKATFSGHIKLRMPTFDERYEAMEQIGVEVNATGEISANSSGIKIIRQMVKSSEKFYTEVALVRLSDNKSFKSVEEMKVDPECDLILLEVARKMSQGFRVSGN